MKKLFLLVLSLAIFTACEDDDNNIIVAQCESPVELGVFDITNSSAKLQWQNNNTTDNVKVEYGLSGFELGTGTILSVSGNEVVVNNLNANTAYDFYVQALCAVDNVSLNSDVYTFNTAINPSVPEFLPNLSQLNLFSGDLGNLTPNANAFIYDLNTRLYTDYAHKQRLIALPNGQAMVYDGDGFPIFPNGTIMAKTFYYLLDETNPNSEKEIIETRVLIRENDAWTIGNYVWNDEQTDAVLDPNEYTVPISWINEAGESMSVDYVVPKHEDCIVCHQTYGNITPIGPRLRSMNFNVNGTNQLQQFINAGSLQGAPDPSNISALPDWTDENIQTETRIRAYFDMNCAHCHAPGGYHTENYYDALNLLIETPFDDSGIYDKRWSIITRIQTTIPGYSMPFIGVSTPHSEAVDLIIPYLESL
jgi:uncharacterized repeat protein (TIGR03806 family)